MRHNAFVVILALVSLLACGGPKAAEGPEPTPAPERRASPATRLAATLTPVVDTQPTVESLVREMPTAGLQIPSWLPTALPKPSPTPGLRATVRVMVQEMISEMLAAMPTPTPIPTPDLRPTVRAMVQEMLAAMPTPTPTPTPIFGTEAGRYNVFQAFIDQMLGTRYMTPTGHRLLEQRFQPLQAEYILKQLGDLLVRTETGVPEPEVGPTVPFLDFLAATSEYPTGFDYRAALERLAPAILGTPPVTPSGEPDIEAMQTIQRVLGGEPGYGGEGLAEDIIQLLMTQGESPMIASAMKGVLEKSFQSFQVYHPEVSLIEEFIRRGYTW